MATTAFSEVAGQITVSAYKWLTNTLLAAQQQYNVRPFFKAKVIDDTVSYVGNFTRYPLQGTLKTAPDGSLLGAGLDQFGNVAFFKAFPATDFATLSWDIQHTLEASGGTFVNPQNRFVIEVSDYVNGSYHIDVYYFTNFVNSASSLQVKHWYSEDGGVTWNSGTFNPLFNFPSSHYDPGYGGIIPNLSIAALKPRFVDGTVFGGFVYINPNNTSLTSGFLCYDMLYDYGDPIGGYTEVLWSPREVNSNDWTLHSLDSFYFGGKDYIVFSGFRNFIDPANTLAPSPNYGIWLTSIQNLTSLITTDLWKNAVTLFSSPSVAYVNQTSFTFPTANIVNGVVNITFRAVTVDSYSPSASGSSSTIVNTHLNYMMMQSTDAVNFSYPSIIVNSSGTEFNDTPTAQRNVSYTDFGTQRWIGGGSVMWEFQQNNIVADISGDVVQYSIQETAGQPASISIQVANQNNIWVGSAPTNPGAAAISANKKIVLLQGYYTSSTTTETVPRNIFFIDDIQQNVTATNNDVTLSGRDLYKKLKILVSKYTFSWFGPYLYTDIFDGSTLSSWNQQVGTWTEAFLSLQLNSATGGDDLVTLSYLPAMTYASQLVVGFTALNATGQIHIYAYYIDSNNWLRVNFDLNASTWTVERNVAGSTTSMDTGSLALASSTQYGVIIRQYDWFKFNFMIQTGGGVTNGYNGIGAFTTPGGGLTVLKNSGTGEYDLSAYVPTTASQHWTVGMGGKNMPCFFRYFKYAQFNNSNNVAELIRSISTKAGIFAYRFQDIFKDSFFNPENWSNPGSWTMVNRLFSISAGSQTNETVTQIDNGEVTFTAKATPVNAASTYSFSFIFRNNLSNAQYRFVVTSTSSGFVSCMFQRIFSGTQYFMAPMTSDAFTNATNLGGLNIDLKKFHTYKVVFSDGWMMAFIDGIMVSAWNDNNTSSGYLTTGYIGFLTNNNTNLYVSQVSSTAFWKQTPTFSINPGDDMEGDALSVVQSVRAWFFSDLWGYLKGLFLNSTDPTTYVYQNQIYAQGVDDSDKEYVSQVTVYGSNVAATARATSLMAGVAVREEVIVDYTITTQEDAQTRANNELINANQYRNQQNPKQTMNVGAEIFDAVTVVNTGNNSAGVNIVTRVYTEKLTTGGNNNEYSLEIDTGNI